MIYILFFKLTDLSPVTAQCYLAAMLRQQITRVLAMQNVIELEIGSYE